MSAESDAISPGLGKLAEVGEIAEQRGIRVVEGTQDRSRGARTLLLQEQGDQVVSGDLVLRVHLEGNVSERRYFFMPRLYDRAEYEFIRTTLSPGGIFVDIGARR